MIELDSLFKGAGVIRYPNGYRMIGLTLHQRFQEEDLSILRNVVHIFGIILVSSGIGHIIEGNVKGLVIMSEIPFIDEIIIGENQNRLRRTPVVR